MATWRERYRLCWCRIERHRIRERIGSHCPRNIVIARVRKATAFPKERHSAIRHITRNPKIGQYLHLIRLFVQ